MKLVRERIVVGIATFTGGRPLGLPKALGSRFAPSAVSVDGHDVLVGAAAHARHRASDPMTKTTRSVANTWTHGTAGAAPSAGAS